jgi:hypothetical protein
MTTVAPVVVATIRPLLRQRSNRVVVIEETGRSSAELSRPFLLEWGIFLGGKDNRAGPPAFTPLPVTMKTLF